MAMVKIRNCNIHLNYMKYQITGITSTGDNFFHWSHIRSSLCIACPITAWCTLRSTCQSKVPSTAPLFTSTLHNEELFRKSICLTIALQSSPSIESSRVFSYDSVKSSPLVATNHVHFKTKFMDT